MAKHEPPTMTDLEEPTGIDPTGPHGELGGPQRPGSITADTVPTEAQVAPPEELRPDKPEMQGADRKTVLLERERRRYVRRRGGLRKNLAKSDIKRAMDLCKQLTWPAEKGWMPMHIGEEVLGKGRVYDNIEHGAKRRAWNSDEDKQRA